MHNKILKKFNKIKLSNLDDYLISLNFLHRIFYLKKSEFRHDGRSILSINNLILLLLSFISIIKCKIFNIKIANYFIVHNNELGKFDNRSKYILDNLNLKKSLNIIRCAKFNESILAYLRYPNVIFYLPLVFLNEPRVKKQFFTRMQYYNFRHKIELLNLKLFKKIFNFLKIKIFISIDDQRVIQLFLKICNELNIYSIGYMHYKFSKFVIGIRYLTFNSFFVWSFYFYKKLLQVNKNYIKSNIFFTGFQKRFVRKENKKKIKILYLMDMDIKFNDIKKIIRDVKKEKKAIIYFKFKPQISFSFQQKMINFFDIEGIKYFQYESLNEIAKKIRFDFFLASVTTALLEAPLYGAMPLKLCNNNDFANDLIIDKVVIPIKKISDIVNVIKKKPSIKKINKIKKKIWGLKKNNSLTTRNILSNLIK